MKRRPLRPSLTPLKRGELRRGRPLGPGTTPLPQRASPLKQTRHRKCWAHLRDKPFREWVAQQGCILRGRPGHVCKGRVEFAHLDNEGMGHPDQGNGVGLCGLSGHREGSKSLHVLGKRSFPRYWKLDLRKIATELLADYERGEFA